MRVLIVFFLLSSFSFAQEQLEKLTTTEGTIYEAVTVTGVKKDTASFMYKGGTAKVSLDSFIPEDKAKLELIRTGNEQLSKNRQAEKVDQRIFDDLWEPFPSDIKVLTGSPLEESKRRLEILNLKLEVLHNVCIPLFNAKKASLEDIKLWVRCVYSDKIIVGMPADLVLAAWGRPSRMSQSSSGSGYWYYNEGYFKGTSISIRSGSVASWYSNR